MYTVNFVTVVGVLLVYAGLLVVILAYRPRIGRTELTTFLTIGGVWAVSVFIGNYLLYRAGLMSFLPWVNNFLHTFVWIGGILTVLFFALREDHGLVVQCIVFAVFSLVVKYAEHLLFGTWDLDHFFHVFRGNAAYIVGWSLADGLYPILTMVGLRLVSPRVRGLVYQ